MFTLCLRKNLICPQKELCKASIIMLLCLSVKESVMNMYIKRVKAEIAYHNKYPQSRALPYWAKLLWVLLDMNDDKYSNRHWKIIKKIRKWFFKGYLDGKVDE